MRSQITNFSCNSAKSLLLVLVPVLGLSFTFDCSGQEGQKIKYVPLQQELDEDEDAAEEDSEDGDEQNQNTRILESLSDGTELTKSIMDIQLNVIDYAASKPTDESRKLFEMSYSSNYPSTFQHRLASWCAPNIRYQPLYFEDVGLERYGYSLDDRVQPLASAFYFAKSFTFLTLNMARQRPSSCTTPLGFCRPGSPAPQIEPKWLRRHR